LERLTEVKAFAGPRLYMQWRHAGAVCHYVAGRLPEGRAFGDQHNPFEELDRGTDNPEQ
jgi:hypothetical protein